MRWMRRSPPRRLEFYEFFCRTFLKVGIPYFDIFLLLCLECPRASLRESPMCSLKIKSVGSTPPRTFLKSGFGFLCLFTGGNIVITRALGRAFYKSSLIVFPLKTPTSFAHANLLSEPEFESPTRLRLFYAKKIKKLNKSQVHLEIKPRSINSALGVGAQCA